MYCINAIACFIMLGFSVWAVLSPSFKDGIMMKSALFIISLVGLSGFINALERAPHLMWQQVLANIGFALLVSAMVARRIHRRVWHEAARRGKKIPRH